MPKIKVTVIGADKQLSDTMGNSITSGKGFKYTYQKQLLSRLRVVMSNTSDLPPEEQLIVISNMLITERNIANYAAEQYAQLDQDDIFNSFTEIAEEIEALFE
jgi:mannitol-specific phosphotransferase system IIBC component